MTLIFAQLANEGKQFTVSIDRRVFVGPVLAVSLAACGGGVTPNLPTPASAFASAVPARDLGRAYAAEPIRIVALLRYNHAAELERFVDTLEREHRPRYLTRNGFIARYAPTVQQEQRVVETLQKAGFQVTHRYANRLIVDAIAPAATVERMFSTEIHDFREARYGVRSANVRPLRIPTELSSYVAAVEANTLILARSGIEYGRVAAAPASKNVVQNGGFETGSLAPWSSCGTASVAISHEHPKTGRYDVLLGSTDGEVNGWSAICQRVTVPRKAVLSAWLYQLTNEPNRKRAYQEVALADAAGTPTTVLFKTNVNYAGWAHQTWDLSKYAGKDETLFFGVYGSSRKAYYAAQFVDDVSLAAVTPSPTPMPGFGPGNAWGPSKVAQGVSMPSANGEDGKGQTVAIVIDATAAPSDLRTYLQYFHINQTGAVTNEAVDGGGDDLADEGEAALDVETIAGLAPAADIIVYDTNNLSNQSIEDAYDQIVSDGKANVVNSSFSECEALDSSFTALTESIALGASAQGVTFSAATGDVGEACYDGGNYAVGAAAPGSDPHFVGVGGTQSGSASGPTTPIANPAVWNDLAGAGGGGVSTVWTPPPYQQGIAGASLSGRNEPDIALPAVHDSLLLNGAWYGVWGTSWASPIYVAMQTEINQACATPLWGINALYGAFAKSGYSHDFVDVTSGNNSWGGKLGLLATTGFDNASGIGIPLGTEIATDDCGKP